MLELAARLDLNCLTQKCEETLASNEFELTTGNSQLDSHSVVRWAYIAQKHHLLVRGLSTASSLNEKRYVFHRLETVSLS